MPHNSAPQTIAFNYFIGVMVQFVRSLNIHEIPVQARHTPEMIH